MTTKPNEKVLQKEIGSRLAEYRNARYGISQAAMAPRVGVSMQSVYGGYETGFRQAKYSILKRIAEDGLNLNYMFTGEGPMLRSSISEELHIKASTECLNEILNHATELTGKLDKTEIVRAAQDCCRKLIQFYTGSDKSADNADRLALIAKHDNALQELRDTLTGK